MTKLTSALFALCAFLPLALAQTNASVFYNATYDNPSVRLSTLACSSNSYGPATLGALPDFPFLGGASSVRGWDSDSCGTCWNVTYQGTTVTILVVDTAKDTFDISEEAFNTLTNDEAILFTSPLMAEAVQVDLALCGVAGS